MAAEASIAPGSPRQQHRVVWLLAILLGLAGLLLLRSLDIRTENAAPTPGALIEEQAAYDVRHYELRLALEPETRSLEGRNAITVEALAPLQRFVVHLDERLVISEVTVDDEPAKYRHREGLVSVRLNSRWGPGERHRVEIAYRGPTKIAIHPPWYDGFVWQVTPSGQPWVGVLSQSSGADHWWPCKDHLSDEADEGMDIQLTVPSNLVGLSNGRLLEQQQNENGTTTTRWRVHYPISNYAVAIAVAPYLAVEEPYSRADGRPSTSLVLWVLPEQLETARLWWAQAPNILAYLEELFGEYPFIEDKFSVVQSPFLGMEHQTLLGYGGRLRNNSWGFDSVLVHEMAHEWWGNEITVGDGADLWLQEGPATYFEALYAEHLGGRNSYLAYLSQLANGISNSLPIVQGNDLTTHQAYHQDVYNKSALVLHSLRYLVGDPTFFDILRGFVDQPNNPHRIVSTNEWIEWVAERSDRQLDWFWSRYLYRADLPRWTMERDGDEVHLSWDDSRFRMPLPISVDGVEQRIEMFGGKATFQAAPDAEIQIDPEGWILDASPPSEPHWDVEDAA